jgi:tungstate transport system ATP-binding protein
VVVAILPLTLTGGVVARRGAVLMGPVDLALGTTGATVILGPNGAGKTTLLRALHGLERLSKGRLEWAVPLTQANMAQAFVFQSPIILRRSVLDNLTYPLRLTGMARGPARDLAADWADRIGLTPALHRHAPTLSGGERQKLALARALIRTPQVLFLDEPCANLDGRATREIEVMLHAAQQGGTRIVMSTHNMGQARRIATEVVVMVAGRVVETGPAPTFFAHPCTPQARALLNGDIVE